MRGRSVMRVTNDSVGVIYRPIGVNNVRSMAGPLPFLYSRPLYPNNGGVPGLDAQGNDR
jgi:hypothetical protein